jgi:hypothetical protein
MFAGFFFALLPAGFTGLNAFDLLGTGVAAAVLLSQAAWPRAWAFAARRYTHAQSRAGSGPAFEPKSAITKKR